VKMVRGAELSICALPLERPVRLGSTVYTSRDVAVLRLVDDQGRVGVGVGYTRGTPMAAAFEAISDRFVGSDPWERRGVMHDLRSAYLHGAASFVRVAGLVDIALHDLAAQAAAVPLRHLLGGLRGRVPAMAVAGYFADDRPPESIVDEVLERVGEGYRAIKLVLLLAEVEADIALIESVRSAIPTTGLAVDLHGAMRSTREAQAMLARLDQYDLLFVEDPFPFDARTATGRIAARTATPIAAGEDAGSLDDLRLLSESVDVLRVDATASGGITTAITAADVASAAGISVLPHVWEYVHGHIAGAHPAIEWVERIPPDTRADPIELLGLTPLPMTDGELELPVGPGLGVDLDAEAVAAYRKAAVCAGQPID
jgi:L-alanine-DL-glutamate epimerase-like enolase superfamily enzyme